jgi:hypothetical protein
LPTELLCVLPTLLNTFCRLLPTTRNAVMMTTEIKAAISPYSIAVAPASLSQNRR